MATDRESVTVYNLLKCCIFFLMCVISFLAQAQKGLLGNLVKVATDQYGFIVGSNQKDTLYFITVTSAKITKEQNEISVIFSDGKTTNRARFVDQFDVSGKNVALYRYIGSTAKRADSKYYDDFFPSDHQQYSLMVDGTASREADFKIYPYIHKIHKAVFQETAPGKSELYYFNKTGGILQQGMVILNESGKAVVGIVADNDGAKSDRFAVIKITNIAERLERADRSSCRYFNLLKTGESLTPCKKEAIRKEEERLRHIREDIERKNRTRQQRREVRRTSDYWFSAGITTSYHWPSMSVQIPMTGGKSAHGKGYSIGTSIYFNPNPTAFGGSIRPRYTSSTFKMPEKYDVGPGNSPVILKKLYMEAYEMPIVFENGSAPFYFAVGYVPVLLTQTKLTYTIGNELSERKDEIFGGPKYLHKAHAEVGFQINATRLGVAFQYQFGTYINKQYELIIDGQMIKPLEGFYDGHYAFSVELSYRLFSKWRFKPEKV